MKRPYIPLKTRLAVLLRQAFEDRKFANADEREAAREFYRICCHCRPTRYRIKWLIQLLFYGGKVELDHDPALELRRFNQRTGKYSPDANNPYYLVYRLKPNHLQKTVGRKPGAERTVTTKGSDVWLAKKYRKLGRPKKSKPMASRSFPKGKRVLRSKSSFATRAGKRS